MQLSCTEYKVFSQLSNCIKKCYIEEYAGVEGERAR
jgi:hypothetical protein